MGTASISSSEDRKRGVPRYLWSIALAVTSNTIGADWDVSWHRSIGRDMFWTPAAHGDLSAAFWRAFPAGT
jgi:hypothetical protein